MADAPSPSEGASANLNILCQTLPPPGRFPMTNLPLTITIGQLRNRIAEIFPGNPPPATQRLIYQGRALLDDSVTLGAILPSANVSLLKLQFLLLSPD
jgi:hypothetical protein